MNPCLFANFISVLACDIAKGKTQEELAILSAFFTQLGDTLATLSLFDNDCWFRFIYFKKFIIPIYCQLG